LTLRWQTHSRLLSRAVQISSQQGEVTWRLWMSRKVDPLELLDQVRPSRRMLLLAKPTPSASFKTRLSVCRWPLHRCV